MITNEEKIEMKTLSSCMNALKGQGFSENFMVNERGLYALDSDKVYSPEEVKIVNFYRFEGDSDPGDGSILYALETVNGIKGTLSDAYGAYGDSEVIKFMDQVEEIMKGKTSEMQK